MTTIKGEASLLKKLRTIPIRQKAKVKLAMETQADVITDMMRRLVPVDDGDLRDSIDWRWGNSAPQGSIAVASVGGDGDLTITIFAGNSKAYYARWVEFGTSPHSTAKGADLSRGKLQDSGAGHPGTTAQPFFFPSWRANRKPTKRAIQAALRAAAKEVARGG